MKRANHGRLRVAGCALLLTLWIAGCQKSASPDVTEVTKPAPVKPTVPTIEDPNTSLRLNPPVVTALEVTALDDSGEGALLTASFEDDPRLKDTVELRIDGQQISLARVKDTRNTFSGKIPFDWKVMSTELSLAGKGLIRAEPAPIFKMRTLVGTRERFSAASFDPAAFERARVTKKPFKIPFDVIDWMWLFVDPARELLITDLTVVEDPTRTFDPCTGAGTAGGAWTFGKLMTDMANQSATGVDPSDFVRHWMATWLTDHQINTFTVSNRSAKVQTLLSNWPKLPNGKLNLAKAPFRLLAIVNRLDLRTNNAYGGGDAGEGRFVFGLVPQAADGTCPGSAESQMTVILEYGVPLSGCTAVHDYGQKWMALGNIALGDAAFNPALQALTDVFAATGAGGAKPNGSAINQIRTNDFVFGSPWDLREFRIDPSSHHLGIVMPVKQPHEAHRNNAIIDGIIAANAPAIVNGTFSFPDRFPDNATGTPFRGGQAINNLAPWRGAANDPTLTDARHQFSLDTCDACHGGEALSTSGNPFLHIRTRQSGAVATLSTFLVGDGTLSAPSKHDFKDPFVTTKSRAMGDLQRRRQDLAKLSGSCRASGLLAELVTKPLLMSH